MTDTRKQKTISAVETSFEILQILSEIEPAGVSEITEEIQISTSTVFSYVNTLVQEGYVIKTGTKYTRSLRFLEAAGSIRRHELYILPDGNQTMLNELATNTGFDKYLTEIVSVEVSRYSNHIRRPTRTLRTTLTARLKTVQMVATHTFDVAGAQAAGMKTILVSRFNVPATRLSHTPEMVVDSYAELATKLS